MIIFRTAFNLADHGQLAFNLGEPTTGVTSTVYALMLAALRATFGAAVFWAIIAVNTLLSVAAAGLFASALEQGTRRLLLWAAIAVLPVSLLVSYSGMETALLLAALGLAAYGVTYAKTSRMLTVAVFILPLVRGDAAGFALLFIAACFLVERRRAFEGLVALALTVAMVAGANMLLTGTAGAPDGDRQGAVVSAGPVPRGLPRSARGAVPERQLSAALQYEVRALSRSRRDGGLSSGGAARFAPACGGTLRGGRRSWR